MKTKSLKSLKGLPKADIHLVEPPRMEYETPHKRLARLTAEQEHLTKEIQQLKTAWAERNFLAQRTREPVPTPEITAFKTKHRDVSCALAQVNLDIGAVGKEIRQHKSEVQNRRRIPEPQPSRRNGIKQVAPIKRHVEFPAYFLLAAEAELDARMFTKITGVAKSMLQNAVQMGIEGND